MSYKPRYENNVALMSVVTNFDFLGLISILSSGLKYSFNREYDLTMNLSTWIAFYENSK